MLPGLDVGFSEIVVIGIVLLLVVGPNRLPDLAKTVGKGIRKVRRASADLRDAIDVEEVRQMKRDVLGESRRVWDQATGIDDEEEEDEAERAAREKKERRKAAQAKAAAAAASAAIVGDAAAATEPEAAIVGDATRANAVPVPLEEKAPIAAYAPADPEEEEDLGPVPRGPAHASLPAKKADGPDPTA